jgi:dTDP-4-dehydrorhamnose 3,5-epimerase
MKFIPQSIPDVIIVKPDIHLDNRGYFIETFRQDIFEHNLGYKVNFIQDNETKSTKGILRGLHYQTPPYTQAKLVRVIKGRVLDVAIDIRRSSPNFGRYVMVELNADNKYQLFVPRGFAHGFIVLSDEAIFAYKVDNYYSQMHDRGIRFDDEELAINWQLPNEKIHLSKKDTLHPNLANAQDLFE